MKTSLIPEQIWGQLESVIQDNTSFTITSHVNPDGDAVGSELALYNFLTKKRKRVRIINCNSLPVVYHFLTESQELYREFSEADNDWINGCDVIFILDISNKDRLS